MRVLAAVLLVLALGGCCISPFCTGPRERMEERR